MTSQEAVDAVHARINGEWDNPALVAWGLLTVSTADDVQSIKRQFLLDCGYVVGARDPRLNRNYPGAFMVAEAHEESELPTDDGSNGPWCVVGDDLDQLVNTAFDVAVDVYGD